MSLRQQYAGVTTAQNVAADPLNAPLSKVAADIAHDLRFMARAVEVQGQTGLKRFFAGLKAGRPRGARNTDTNTLSFSLGGNTITINESYWGAMREVAEDLNKTVGAHLYGPDYTPGHLSPRSEYKYEDRLRRVAGEKTKSLQTSYLTQARALPPYAEIHALCADPAVDIRVELVVEDVIGHKDEIRNGGGGYSWDAAKDKASTTLQVAVRLYLNEPYSASSDAAFFAEKKAKSAGPAPSVS